MVILLLGVNSRELVGGPPCLSREKEGLGEFSFRSFAGLRGFGCGVGGCVCKEWFSFGGDTSGWKLCKLGPGVLGEDRAGSPIRNPGKKPDLVLCWGGFQVF